MGDATSSGRSSIDACGAIVVAVKRGWRNPVPVLLVAAYHVALIPWANAVDLV